MEKEYIGLIGVIIGSGIVGGINYLRMLNDEKKEKRAIYVQKLEEVHETITNIREIYRHEFVEHIRIINHGIGVASKESPKTLPIDHLKMLIDFYIPFLRSKFEEFEKYRKEYGEVLILCMDADKLDSSRRSKLKNMISDGLGIIEKHCTDMQKEISKEANKYLET